MQSISNLRCLELFTNVAKAFCSTIQKWKSFVSEPDKITFSLPTKWGYFYKTDNADWRRFIKYLHFKRDKNALSLPTKWGDFCKTENSDWRGFIKHLHFERDKIAFSLPCKWEKNFLENWVPFFALFAIVVLWGTFLRKAGAAKKFESKWEKQKGFATVYPWGGNKEIQIHLSVFGVPCPSVIMKGLWVGKKNFPASETFWPCVS